MKIGTRCTTCNDIVLTERHACPPTWYVRLDPADYGDRAEMVHAYSKDTAAERFVARIADTIDYPASVEVQVRDRDKATWFHYIVTIDWIPEFTALPDLHRQPLEEAEEAKED